MRTDIDPARHLLTTLALHGVCPSCANRPAAPKSAPGARFGAPSTEANGISLHEGHDRESGATAGAWPCSPGGERRTTIPILANVLIEATAGELLLKATDLDLEITERAAADVTQEGATTLPAHTLYDITRKLPEGAQVSLEETGEQGQLTLRSGRSRFQLQTCRRAIFPR